MVGWGKLSEGGLPANVLQVNYSLLTFDILVVPYLLNKLFCLNFLVFKGWTCLTIYSLYYLTHFFQEVLVPIISQKQCRHKTRWHCLVKAQRKLFNISSCSYRQDEITENMFCAGFDQGKIDACQVKTTKLFFLIFTDKFRVTAVAQLCGRGTVMGSSLKLVSETQPETSEVIFRNCLLGPGLR